MCMLPMYHKMGYFCEVQSSQILRVHLKFSEI